jgi:vacuolar-type H+-ATPase subunit D/Vma8
MKCFAETYKKTLKPKHSFIILQISDMIDLYSQMLRDIENLDESELNQLNKFLEKQSVMLEEWRYRK